MAMKILSSAQVRNVLGRVPDPVRQAVRQFRRRPNQKRWEELRSLLCPSLLSDGEQLAVTTVWHAVQETAGRKLAYDEKPTVDDIDWWLKVYYGTECRKP